MLKRQHPGPDLAPAPSISVSVSLAFEMACSFLHLQYQCVKANSKWQSSGFPSALTFMALILSLPLFDFCFCFSKNGLSARPGRNPGHLPLRIAAVWQ
jgi:hypothetical protein